jgi:hypothetical protein
MVTRGASCEVGLFYYCLDDEPEGLTASRTTAWTLDLQKFLVVGWRQDEPTGGKTLVGSDSDIPRGGGLQYLCRNPVYAGIKLIVPGNIVITSLVMSPQPTASLCNIRLHDCYRAQSSSVHHGVAL